MISRARGPGEVDRRQPLRDVGQAHVEAPVGQPPREPLVDRAGAARRGGHVERVVVEPADRAVVHDPPGVAGDHAVADPARLEVREAVRVEAVEELAGVGAAHDQLAERRHVDQAGGLVHRQRLGLSGRRSRRRAASRPPTSRWRPARGGGRGWPSAWRARTAGRRARPSARRARAAARSWCRPAPGSARSPAPSAAPRAAGTCAPGTGPSSWSCSAWTARSSRSPPRPTRWMSLAVTSSHRQAKHLPSRAARDGGRHGHVGRLARRRRARRRPRVALAEPERPRRGAPAAAAGVLGVLQVAAAPATSPAA